MKFVFILGALCAVIALQSLDAGEGGSSIPKARIEESLLIAKTRMPERIMDKMFMPTGYVHHHSGKWHEHFIAVESRSSIPNSLEVYTKQMLDELLALKANAVIYEFIMVYGGQGVVKVLIQESKGSPVEFSAKIISLTELNELHASSLSPSVKSVTK